MSDASQVADSQSPISVVEFARRQLAVVEVPIFDYHS